MEINNFKIAIIRNMRDASLDILEALRKYLDNLGIEPSKDIFDEIDRLIKRKNNKQNSDD